MLHLRSFAEIILKAIAEVEAIGAKVEGLTTDNAPAMRNARRIVVGTDGHKHIVEMRCFMHAFSLLIASILSHVFAAELVKKSQRIVTYVHASHKIRSNFNSIAASLGIRGGGLQTSNATRFDSVCVCLASVHRNRRALEMLVEQHESDFGATARGNITLLFVTCHTAELFGLLYHAIS